MSAAGFNDDQKARMLTRDVHVSLRRREVDVGRVVVRMRVVVREGGSNLLLMVVR